MTNVYKFVPEKGGDSILLEQDSELRAIEDFIAHLGLKAEQYNVVEILYLAEKVSLKIMQTTEEDPKILAWYYMQQQDATSEEQ